MIKLHKTIYIEVYGDDEIDIEDCEQQAFFCIGQGREVGWNHQPDRGFEFKIECDTKEMPHLNTLR